MYKLNKTPGFTMIELIVLLVLIGVLAAYVLPRLSLRGSFDERVFKDELIASARFAQQLAMLRGRGYTVQFIVDNANSRYGIQTRLGTGSYAWFSHPNGEPYPISYASGITTSPSPVTITFDALGNVSAATTQTITITGAASATLCIEASGFARVGSC